MCIYTDHMFVCLICNKTDAFHAHEAVFARFFHARKLETYRQTAKTQEKALFRVVKGLNGLGAR